MTSSIGRRDLFKLGGKQAAGIAYELTAAKVAVRAEAWVRPPFAIDELDFMLGCTRCDKCIDACPHDVLFALGERPQPHAAGTPAMDLPRRGCHMCADWPCVTACEPGVLKRSPEDGGQSPAVPKFAVATIDTKTCLPYAGPECGACAGSCPVPGALDWEGGVRPVIDPELCSGCAMCREACIVDPKAIGISALIAGDGGAWVS